MQPSDWQYTPLTIPLLLIGLLCAWVAHVAWRRRVLPGAVPFAVLMTGIAGWTLTDLLEKSLTHYELRRAVSTLSYVFITMTPGAWFAFAVRFSRFDGWLTPRVARLLFVHPLLVVALALTDHWHGLFRTGTEMAEGGPYAVMVIRYGPLFWVHTAYTYALFAAGAVFMVAGAARRPNVTWGQRVTLLTGMLVPTLGNVAYVFRWHSADFGDLTPLYFGVTGLLAARMLFHVRLFDVLPLARDFVFDRLADPVFVLDNQRRLLDMSPAAEKLRDCPAKRPRQQPFAELFPELSRLLPTELPQEGVTVEVPLALLAGNRFWDMQVLPMRDHGAPVGVLVRLTDVTERKRAESERRALDGRLRQVQKLESMAVLAGGVAHDFNNLLTVILGNTELALADPDARPVAPLLQSVVGAANQAAGLARQMLTYAGRAHFLPRSVSLSGLIRDMGDLLRAAVPRQIALELDLDAGLDSIAGDPDQLRQLVLNLVVNAADALGEQPGTICICTRRAEVRAADLAATMANEGLAAGVHLLLEVSDTGAGMDAATLDRAFEPFFTTKFTGRGLGLPVVLGVVRAHGGAIFVSSEPGVGTQFRVVFPFAPALAPPPVPPRVPAAPARAEPVPPDTGTVLLVDDDVLVRAVADQFLREAGFRVHEARDGAEALAVYQAHAADIDVVLLDLTMPVMTGSEVLQRLHERNPHLPVIVMSGYDAQTAQERVRGNVPSAFLCKPYGGEELIALVREVLARRQRV